MRSCQAWQACLCSCTKRGGKRACSSRVISRKHSRSSPSQHRTGLRSGTHNRVHVRKHLWHDLSKSSPAAAQQDAHTAPGALALLYLSSGMLQQCSDITEDMYGVPSPSITHHTCTTPVCGACGIRYLYVAMQIHGSTNPQIHKSTNPPSSPPRRCGWQVDKTFSCLWMLWRHAELTHCTAMQEMD